MRFYVTNQLGPKRFLTPEGYLLAKDVPVARTGTQIYREGEVPVEASRDGEIRIQRYDHEVFDGDSIASYSGKPVVLDHPDENVDPSNWRKYTVGVVLDPRQGRGTDADLLFADLMIFDPRGIAAINDNGVREVSVGYDADYTQDTPGVGAQHNIRCNHVALVDRGRCGPRCAVGDAACCGECEDTEDHMSNRGGFLSRMRDAWRKGDQKAFDEILGELSGQPDQQPEPQAAGPSAGPHHVTVNVHPPSAGGAPETDQTQPVASPTAAPTLQAGPAGAQATAPGDQPQPGGPGAAGGDINARLMKLEALLAALMQKLGGETPGAEAGGGGGGGGGAPPEKKGSSVGGDEDPDEEETDDEGGELTEAEPAEHETEMLGETDLPAAGGADRARDKKRGARDSISLQEAFRDMMTRAEILSPGIRLPNYDAAIGPERIEKRMCAFRRRALAEAWNKPGGKDLIGPFLGAKPKHLDAMTCDAVELVFNGASHAKGLMNKSRNLSARRMADEHEDLGAAIITNAEINAKQRAYWEKRGGRVH